eukprot:UN03740
MIQEKNYEEFWETHKERNNINFSEDLKDLIIGLVLNDPKKRLNLKQAVKHKWCMGPNLLNDKNGLRRRIQSIKSEAKKRYKKEADDKLKKEQADAELRVKRIKKGPLKIMINYFYR